MLYYNSFFLFKKFYIYLGTNFYSYSISEYNLNYYKSLIYNIFLKFLVKQIFKIKALL
jgi:hypothetical protein